MSLEIIILAAGQGTRMRSAQPKVLHKIGCFSLVEHVHKLAQSLKANTTIIVYGHGGEKVASELGYLSVKWVEQKEQLGTGHAVMQVADLIADEATVLILYGDVPLLRKNTVEKILSSAKDGRLGLLTVNLQDPYGYGRIVRDSKGKVLRIVEEKDANAYERQINEVNTGIFAVRGGYLKQWIGRLENKNAQREYYLTDVVEMAVNEGLLIETNQPKDQEEVLGVNNRVQLSRLERTYQQQMAEELMSQGVTLRDPMRFDLRGEIEVIGQDVEIDVNVVLEGRLQIGDRVRIGPNTVIRNSKIGDDVNIEANCIIEGAVIGCGSRVGPFARLRPETVLEANVHIGNFVEIKKTSIDEGSKVNHLSYIGDCKIGSKVNIGAGTITCNFDGANKHHTIIEDNAFIGSDTQLVAPVRVGKNATIGAGSTITRDTPENALTLSRTVQTSIKGWKRPEKRGTE